jgi:hypothetical protein
MPGRPHNLADEMHLGAGGPGCALIVGNLQAGRGAHCPAVWGKARLRCARQGAPAMKHVLTDTASRRVHEHTGRQPALSFFS